MTRPRIPDDKRQRTAQACESCKRRKQKCNGLRPCNTCTKRNLTCSYTFNSPDLDEPGGSPTKRRHLDTSPPPGPDKGDVAVVVKPSPPSGEASPTWDKKAGVPDETAPLKVEFNVQKPSAEANLQHQRRTSDHDLEIHSRNSTISCPDEEAVLYSTTRMLQDQTGRLLYLGDSATLSYLHLFRYIVETISGPSPFTLDPRKERIVENVVSLPPHIRPPCMKPDRQTAEVLVESYFTNTSGLIEVFDEPSFKRSFDACYSDPLEADSSFLCHLYLIFAIGLVLATPVPGSADDAIIERLNARQYDQAELFFQSAKCLADPLTDIEDADFWSVQALLLMSVYMLAVSKRNAAYAYHGMAVRSAIALGLHREEPMVMFRDAQLVLRCNLWRSLFILDRFLAASLGRPTAISEDDCSDATLSLPHAPAAAFAGPAVNPSHSEGVDADVRSSRVIGVILKKVYAQRRVNLRTSQDIVRRCLPWPQKLHPTLHWRQAVGGRISASQGIAILHVNLLYCHAVVLLTRPHFLHVVQADRSGAPGSAPRPMSRMERFSEVCVSAAYHSIAMVHTAYEGHYLPRRDPFAMYFLFAAALVVLSNEFASLHQTPAAEARITQSIQVMAYCAETDPQGQRLLWILQAFQNVVAKQSTGPRHYRFTTPSPLKSHLGDPIASFFTGHPSSHSSDTGPSNSSANPKPSRQNSLTAGPLAPSAVTASALTKPVPPVRSGSISEGIIPLNGTSPQLLAGGPVLPSPRTRYAVDGGTEADAPDSLGTDAGFDFDSLWNWAPGLGHHAVAPGVATAGHLHHVPVPPATQRPFAAFPPGFGMPGGPETVGHGMNGRDHVPTTGMNMNVPLYPTSDFG